MRKFRPDLSICLNDIAEKQVTVKLKPIVIFCSVVNFRHIIKMFIFGLMTHLDPYPPIILLPKCSNYVHI